MNIGTFFLCFAVCISSCCALFGQIGVPVNGLSDSGETGFELRKGTYLRKRTSAAHCGIYALAGALKSQGVEPDIGALLSDEFLGSQKGSSVDDLVRGAKLHSVNAYAVKNASIQWLGGLNCPILLLLKGTRRAEGTRHWITFLGIRDGKAVIFDAPREIESVGLAELMAYWDGVAVVVDRNRSGFDKQVAQARSRCAPVVWFLLIAMASGVLATLPLVRRLAHSACSIRIVLVLFATLALSGTYHMVSPVGFFGNQLAIGCVAADYRVPPEHFQTVTYAQLCALIDSDSINLLDARIPISFANGHIKGAFNFPVDASLGEFNDLVDYVNPDLPIVIYCESNGCAWDQIVADRLYRIGFRNIRLFESGWRGYKAKTLSDHTDLGRQ